MVSALFCQANLQILFGASERRTLQTKYLPDLKKQIKTGKKQPQPRNDYEREDIKQFHIIDNKLDGKNLEYQIAEDIHGNKYYFTKM